MVNFLFVLIELFSQSITVPEYEANVYSSAVFFALKFYLDMVVTHQPFLSPEN